MSGTFQAAEQVADRMGFPVHVVHSKGPTMRSRLAGSPRRAGSGRERYEMLAAADKVREKLMLIVS